MAEELLSDIRAGIDALDRQILALISQRAELAVKVAQRKIAAGETGSFYRADREAEVLAAIRDANRGPLPDESVMWLFRELMSACLALEKPLQIACLGPEGTFSEMAAIKHFGHAAQTVPLPGISDVFREVSHDHCQYGVVPVENSTEGVVNHTLDQFIDSPLLIGGEVVLRVHHNLLALPGSDSDAVEEVFAHQQALAQCREWLAVHMPGVRQTAVSSNAEAARIAAGNPAVAAIAAETAAQRYGLSVLHRHIEDGVENTTRFYVIGKQQVGRTREDKTTLMIATGNRPGALFKVLQPLAESGISMTKIESRPSRQGNWNYIFFVEIEGHREDPGVAGALKALESNVISCKVLGSYPKAMLK